jgi:hypothetical protein
MSADLTPDTSVEMSVAPRHGVLIGGIEDKSGRRFRSKRVKHWPGACLVSNFSRRVLKFSISWAATPQQSATISDDRDLIRP